MSTNDNAQYPYGQGNQGYQNASGQNVSGQYAAGQTGQYYYQQAAQPAPPQSSWTSGWFAVSDPGYIKGLLLGAGLTYVLTNPKVQRALVKGAVTLWTAVQGGVEEVKEQVLDIKSEMSMKSHDPE